MSDVEYSPYPQCYDVSNTAERPKHKNWVIPAGTTMLVDFDTVVQAQRTALLDAVEERVVGNDEFNMPTSTLGKLNAAMTYNASKPELERDKLRADQRQALAALRQEGVILPPEHPDL